MSHNSNYDGQPPEYDPQHSYSQPNGVSGQPLDNDFAQISNSVNHIISNLKAIQRDDHQLANKSVDWDQLSDAVIKAINAGGGGEDLHVVSGTYSQGTLTLTLNDGSTVVVTGWADLTGIDFRQDGSDIGLFDAVEFSGAGVKASRKASVLEVTIDGPSTQVGNHFTGIYGNLKNLQDAITFPADNYQAIVLSPSEKYYHGVGGQWVELAPVSSFHPTYLGYYDSVADLNVAQPTPHEDDLAIVGTTEKGFYLYSNNQWKALKGTDLPALTARVTDVETKSEDNKKRLDAAEGHLQTLQTGQQVLQSNIDQKISGIHIEDVDNNAFDNVNSLLFDGATASLQNGSAKVTISPKITVANGQEPGSVSLQGNALIFPGAAVSADPNDPNVLIVGRTDTPTFDPSMFQSAVDHGYAPDDQGIKSSATKDGWWIFKDLKSVGSRPSDAVGDLFVFRNNLDIANPALKHVFIMAIGKDKQLQNKIWFMYRDGTTWTPWFSEQGASQAAIDNLSSSVDELKRGNQAVIDEVTKLKTAAGNLYAPDKSTFDKAVNALIQAALKDYKPISPGHGGDKPATVYPRIYVEFSNAIPTDFTSATTSTNAEATLVSAPLQPSRIFISVENDADEASKVVGFKFNNKQEMTLQHRDIVVGGKKYRAFYTAGAFTEAGINVKVDFGQGI